MGVNTITVSQPDRVPEAIVLIKAMQTEIADIKKDLAIVKVDVTVIKTDVIEIKEK